MNVVIYMNTSFGGDEVEHYNGVRKMYVEDECLWLERIDESLILHLTSIPIEIILKLEVITL